MPLYPSEENDSELLEKLSEYLPVSTARVETAFSRYPIHNLTKNESISIRINQRTQGAEADISWSVSPSRDYGEPRQLAYRLDTLVINRRIDEAPRPLPRLIRLGTVREIARELGTAISGQQADAIKQALYQNAFAGITAKISYRSADGRVRRFEKGFTRYSVYFKGEELPNDLGRADAVWIYLNEDYWQVLNSAIFRPLDYDYQKGLPAGAHQRFYELVSFAMFAALSKRRDEARLVYSDYCLRAPQTRYLSRDQVQKQMYKIHRPHVQAGYIERLRYRQITDLEGRPDWEIFYTPGPRARAQFAFFRSRQKNEVIEVAQADIAALRAPDEITVQTDRRDEAEELTKRGITKQRAEKLLRSFRGGEEEMTDILEWGDYLVADAAGKIRNPAGFYIYLIEALVLPPPSFETSRVRKLRELAKQKADEERVRTVRLQLAYEDYEEQTIDAHITSLNPEELESLVAAKRKTYRQTLKTLPDKTIDEIARQAVRKDLKESGAVRFMTIDEFARTRNPDQMTLLPM